MARARSPWWASDWILIPFALLGLYAMASWLLPAHAQEIRPEGIPPTPAPASARAEMHPLVRLLLDPNIILALGGLAVGIWKAIQARNYKEAAAVGFKTVGALVTANHALRRDAPPAIKAQLVATLQDVSEQAGIEPLLAKIVERTKPSKDGGPPTEIDAAAAAEAVVRGATKKMRRTVIETPTPQLEDVAKTPVEGTPTQPPST